MYLKIITPGQWESNVEIYGHKVERIFQSLEKGTEILKLIKSKATFLVYPMDAEYEGFDETLCSISCVRFVNQKDPVYIVHEHEVKVYLMDENGKTIDKI